MAMKNDTPPATTTRTTPYVFVIGDICGHNNLLELVQKKIELFGITHLDTLIVLGNAIGDGPASSEVVNNLYHLYSVDDKTKPDFSYVRGRNETLFSKMRAFFTKTPECKAIVKSYVKRPSVYLGAQVDTSEMVQDRAWLTKLHAFYVMTNHFFCSAGVNPEKELPNQISAQLIFNSFGEEFLKTDKDFGRMIVHGNFNERSNGEVVLKDNRINVFTNPSVTGILACVVLDPAKKGRESIVTTISASLTELRSDEDIVTEENNSPSQVAVS